jgi:hypothetical protein
MTTVATANSHGCVAVRMAIHNHASSAHLRRQRLHHACASATHVHHGPIHGQARLIGPVDLRELDPLRCCHQRLFRMHLCRQDGGLGEEGGVGRTVAADHRAVVGRMSDLISHSIDLCWHPAAHCLSRRRHQQQRSSQRTGRRMPASALRPG